MPKCTGGSNNLVDLFVLFLRYLVWYEFEDFSMSLHIVQTRPVKMFLHIPPSSRVACSNFPNQTLFHQTGYVLRDNTGPIRILRK